MTENKGDLISREALKEEIENLIGYSLSYEAILNAIDNAPTVEPKFKPIAEVKFDKEQLQEIVDKAKAEVLASVERPQGEWIRHIDNLYPEDSTEECPFCHEEQRLVGNDDNYCPNCGADMRGGEK